MKPFKRVFAALLTAMILLGTAGSSLTVFAEETADEQVQSSEEQAEAADEQSTAQSE